MSDIIQLLPESIANQIAAGEVVQRPASLVKELIENSIDARSTEITLIVKEAGKSIVQVVDNGIGMSETDARMSFERHATSKIRRAEDLFAITTMGFRGEALASIAAVAQVELKTKPRENELGTFVNVEGSQTKNHENIACQPGTSIIVKNLFFNVPARRNFLKSNAVEMRHIMEEFTRLALAHPDISFTFYQNDLEVYKLREGKLSQRIVGLFGKNYREQLVPCNESTGDMQLRGYIGKPENAKKSRGEQYFFVNNRYIKSNYLNHAVTSAFEGLIADDQYPFFVLFLDIDPKHIDVNVHPTKTEIKFDDERSVYSLIKTSVKMALGTHNITPAIDFSYDTNFKMYAERQKEKESQISNKNYEQFKNTPQDTSNLKNWESLYAGALRNETFEAASKKEMEMDEGEKISLTFGSKVNNLNITDSNLEDTTGEKTIFQVQLTYLVTQVKSGLMFVDQQAAHERIVFERYLNMMNNKRGSSQQSLFPEHLELKPSDFTLVKELEEEFKTIGFSFEEFGKNTIAINGMPADVNANSAAVIFKGVLEDFKANHLENKAHNVENLARAMAKNAGIKKGKRLAREEMAMMIDQLFACKNPNYAPDGQRIFHILEFEKLNSFFNK